MNNMHEEIIVTLHQLWRQRRLALAVAWGIATPGWLAVTFLPNSYESRARLAVQTRSLLTDKIGVTAGEQQADIDRVRMTLTSGTNLEAIVRGTSLTRAAARERDVAERVDELRDAIAFKALPDNVFEISARTSFSGLSDVENARLAHDIVEQLTTMFSMARFGADPAETAQTLRFLDEELARRQAQLSDVEQKRIAFEQRYMGVLPGTGPIAQRMDQARSELNQVKADLIAAQGLVAAMNGQLASTPATVSGPAAGGAAGSARARIAALEAQLSDAVAKGWTDQHPDVVATHAQIAWLRPEAAREGRGSAEASANPLYLSLRTTRAERQATVAALSARKAQIEAGMTEFSATQADEPGIVAEQTRLARDHDVLVAQYDKLLSDREEMQLRADAGGKAGAVRVAVLDPPSTPRTPVAPKRLLLLIGVFFLAFAAGIGAAFAKVHFAKTYPTAGKLAAATSLPVLGAVSEYVTDAQAAVRHRQLKRFALDAGGLVGCCLLLLAIEFVQRGMTA